MIDSALGTTAVLVGIAAFFFWLHQTTNWRVFEYFPPLLWIYMTPMLLNGAGILPQSSPAYDSLQDISLPILLILMLLSVDIVATMRVLGRSLLLMLFGTAGVVAGAILSYSLFHHWLPPDIWMAIGPLAASWIGGTANLAAVAVALETPPDLLSLSILVDSAVYVMWLPLLLVSRRFSVAFARWARVDPERLRVRAFDESVDPPDRPPVARDYLYLAVAALGTTFLARLTAPLLPEVPPVVTSSTWEILLLSTGALLLGMTRLRTIPGSQQLGLALLYVFLAGMGAKASLTSIGNAPVLLLSALFWILVHGAFCLLGARILRASLGETVVASAANIGGAASATVVAAYHCKTLMPGAILLAMTGYALGTYLGVVTAYLCQSLG